MKLFVARSHYVEGDGRMTVDYESTSYFAVYAADLKEAWTKALKKDRDTEMVEEVGDSLSRDELLAKFNVSIVK